MAKTIRELNSETELSEDSLLVSSDDSTDEAKKVQLKHMASSLPYVKVKSKENYQTGIGTISSSTSPGFIEFSSESAWDAILPGAHLRITSPQEIFFVVYAKSNLPPFPVLSIATLQDMTELAPSTAFEYLNPGVSAEDISDPTNPYLSFYANSQLACTRSINHPEGDPNLKPAISLDPSGAVYLGRQPLLKVNESSTTRVANRGTWYNVVQTATANYILSYGDITMSGGGAYTIPVGGVYRVHAEVRLNPDSGWWADDSEIWFELTRNSVIVMNQLALTSHSYSFTSSSKQISFDTLTNFSGGDELRVIFKFENNPATCDINPLGQTDGTFVEVYKVR